MTRLRRVFLLVSALAVLTACSGESSAPADAGATRDLGAPDAGSDAGSVDAGEPPDAGAEIDADTADAGDARDAASMDDAGASDDAGLDACGYVAVDDVVVRCDMRYVFVSRFQSDTPGCAPFHGFDPGGPRFADTASAIASDASCDPTCQWRFTTSVTRLYCGRRTGYEQLSAPDPSCGDLYRFAEGYFASVEEHDASYPCM
jgi:hypothetical protein